MHIGVHRPLCRVYKEPVNTLNNKYFHTYLKLHTIRPLLFKQISLRLYYPAKVEYAASIETEDKNGET